MEISVVPEVRSNPTWLLAKSTRVRNHDSIWHSGWKTRRAVSIPSAFVRSPRVHTHAVLALSGVALILEKLGEKLPDLTEHVMVYT